MLSQMKQLVKTICNGDFFSKSPKEVIQFQEYVAVVSKGCYDLCHEMHQRRVKRVLSVFQWSI